MGIPRTNATAQIVASSGFVPQVKVAGTINGTAIDRAPSDGLARSLSGKLHVMLGATPSAPTSLTVDCIIQHSPDNSTWATLTDRDGNNVAITQLVAASTEAFVDFQLDGADKYVRPMATVAFVGGSTPSVVIGCAMSMAGQDRES